MSQPKDNVEVQILDAHKISKSYKVVRSFRAPRLGPDTDISGFVVVDGNKHRFVLSRSNGKLYFAEPEEIYHKLREMVACIDEITYCLILLNDKP